MSGQGTIWGRVKLALIFRLARRLPDCRETAPYLSASLDGPLPLDRQIKVRLHLFVCEMCVRYRKQLIFLRETVRAQAQRIEERGEARLSPEARARLKEMLSRAEK